MDVKVDGEIFDVDDPRKRAEAIRRWLKKKAGEKTFTLPQLPPEEERQRGQTPSRPFAPLPG